MFLHLEWAHADANVAPISAPFGSPVHTISSWDTATRLPDKCNYCVKLWLTSSCQYLNRTWMSLVRLPLRVLRMWLHWSLWKSYGCDSIRSPGCWYARFSFHLWFWQEVGEEVWYICPKISSTRVGVQLIMDMQSSSFTVCMAPLRDPEIEMNNMTSLDTELMDHKPSSVWQSRK